MERFLDHAAFARSRANAEIVIDLITLERVSRREGDQDFLRQRLSGRKATAKATRNPKKPAPISGAGAATSTWALAGPTRSQKKAATAIGVDMLCAPPHADLRACR